MAGRAQIQDVVNDRLDELLGGGRWFVDSVSGDDGNNGKSWAAALKTIAAAVTAAVAGDTIYIKGSFSEAVTCAKAGVRFVGAGTVPKEAQWTAPTVAGSWCLKITANYVEVTNIYFKPVIYTSSGVPSGIHLSGANYAYIHHCRFQGQTGSYKAIYAPACDCDNVRITDNEFFYMNTATHGAAIWGVEAGGLAFSGWVIQRNVIHSCVTGININARCCIITDNVLAEYGNAADASLGAVMTLGIDLSGTASGGANIVTGNQLGGTYNATLYKVATGGGDQWAGNYNVITGGLTAANPA